MNIGLPLILRIVDNKLTVFNEGIKYIVSGIPELENWSFSTLRIVFGGGQKFCVRNIDNISLKSFQADAPKCSKRSLFE